MDITRKYKASITVEAALVLPVFLFSILALYYFIVLFSVQNKIYGALADTANQASLYGYYKEGRYPFSVTFYQEISKGWLEDCGVIGGIVSLASSGYEKEDIIVKADYAIKLPVPLMTFRPIMISQSVRTRKFIGNDRRKGTEGVQETAGTDEDSYVYVTENGAVYHRTEECAYLKLKIQETTGRMLYNLRNHNGEIYRCCEYCGSGRQIEADTAVFVAEEGNRYHFTSLCKNLKRTVNRVLYAKVKPVLPPCSKCGGC